MHELLPLEANDTRVFVQDHAVLGRDVVYLYRVSCAISLHRRGHETLDDAIRLGRLVVIEG